MTQRYSKNLLLNTLLILLLTIIVSQPRLQVESRTAMKRDVEKKTSIVRKEFSDENLFASSTEETNPTIKSSSEVTSTKQSQLSVNLKLSTVASTTVELHGEDATFSTEELNISRTSPVVVRPNLSLYDELMATSAYQSIATSSEFLKFDDMRMDFENNDSKSSEFSLETKFNENPEAFKKNITKEEATSIKEDHFDNEEVKYRSVMKYFKNDSEANDITENNTTIPIKQGKYLELVPSGEDNINTSIPNAAEVWALAGMKSFKPRKPSVESEIESNETLNANNNLNNTVKNLLDWTEITKMENGGLAKSDEREEKENNRFNETKNSIKLEFSNPDDDPIANENKDTSINTNSIATPSPMLQITKSPAIKNDNIGLDQEDSGIQNKTHLAISRIDLDVLMQSQEEHDDSEVEMIASHSFNSTEKLNTNENLVLKNFYTTTESYDMSTTISEYEATTTENFETSTNIVDSFTVIGEEYDLDEVFKRKVSHLATTTEQAAVTILLTETTTSRLPPNELTSPERTALKFSTTEGTNRMINEIPEFSQRNHKSTLVTKSISPRVAATTTDLPPDKLDSTENDSILSTLVPVYVSTSKPASVSENDGSRPRISQTIEIIDDESFKYSTLLSETTTIIPAEQSRIEIKNSDVEEHITRDNSMNQENVDIEKGGNSNIVIISASISIFAIGVLAGIIFLLLKKRKKQLTYGQRCRPVGLDAYSLDNVSVYNSVRRKANTLRLSKRSYGNSAFENPSLQSNILNHQSLQDFAKNKNSIHSEFKEIPQVSVRIDELPNNVEDKNRYANVVPLPETSVHLQRLNDDEKTEYINANYVKGPQDVTNYYIATQAPLENTVNDFWRMMWEQNSKVIIQLTDLTENCVERCAEYIPASVVLDNFQTFGDFQVTLKSREVKGKYAVSQLHVKNIKINTWREIMHLWYSWPCEGGCPTDESSVIDLLVEARGFLRTSLPDQLDENSNIEGNNNVDDKQKLSTLDKTKSLQRVQGPLTVHCSPGTGRTGTIIACDIIMRQLEAPPRQVDIPQIVYYVRRGRANSVRTRDQYEFLYKIATSYSSKLNTPLNEIS